MKGYTAEELLCHHGDDEHGHALGEDCPVQITRGQYGPRAAARTPRGTCPRCGAVGVTVKARPILGRAASGVKHRVPLGIDIRLAAHLDPATRESCDAVALPTETRYWLDRGTELAWLREYGEGSVA